MCNLLKFFFESPQELWGPGLKGMIKCHFKSDIIKNSECYKFKHFTYLSKVVC